MTDNQSTTLPEVAAYFAAVEAATQAYNALVTAIGAKHMVPITATRYDAEYIAARQAADAELRQAEDARSAAQIAARGALAASDDKLVAYIASGTLLTDALTAETTAEVLRRAPLNRVDVEAFLFSRHGHQGREYIERAARAGVFGDAAETSTDNGVSPAWAELNAFLGRMRQGGYRTEADELEGIVARRVAEVRAAQ